jgi:LPS export ABC transporter protein LptC
MLKWILIAIFFALIVLELVVFAPEQGDRNLEKDWTSEALNNDPKQEVEQVLSGSHLIESQGEKKMWELESKEARKTKGSDDWVLDQVKVKFFGENSVFYNADGKNGYVGENQKKLKIQGDIKIVSSNGYILKTQTIYYKTDSRSIDGPGFVTLDGPPEKDHSGGPLYMESDNFDADLNTNIINLNQNVKGKKLMSGGRRMKITSQKAIFSGQSNYALFKKDVVIDVDTTTITGPRAKFIYKDGSLYSMYIDGGVKIKDIGKWGVAGEAEVFFKEDKYVLRGSPKVVQGDDQLVGDEIIIYDGGDRVQVKKAKTKYNTNQPGEDKL